VDPDGLAEGSSRHQALLSRLTREGAEESGFVGPAALPPRPWPPAIDGHAEPGHVGKPLAEGGRELVLVTMDEG
jgi:hypothetical protein